MNSGPVPRSSNALLGIRIDSVDRQQVLARIAADVTRGTGGMIANVNIHAMNLAWRDSTFRSIINAADLVFVDGAGVALGARLAGVAVGPRMTPADWIDDLFRLCAQERWPIFWLGDVEEVGAAFWEAVRARHPDTPLAGRHHGFFEHFGPGGEILARAIALSGARILLVGMSMPLQEKWVARFRADLGPVVCLTVGGLARIYTGHIRRGPRWMTEHGLEWLYRLAMQPAYTWRRYLIGNPLFLLRVLMVRWGLLDPPSA